MSSQTAIRLLEEDLINKIAAGEVVERPASVVKELVENALDAQATRIIVSLRDGGKKLIQVADNGTGIPPTELELAVSRHATSKISDFDDLYRLKTKGFRGEALASIASVAQLKLASLAPGHEPHEIVVHAGEPLGIRAAAHAPGTTVAVKHLFYQTPARLKFLRSKETETGHIADIVLKLALSHPNVEFQLLSDDKLIFEAPVFDDAKRRVVTLLGKDLQDMIYPFAGEAQGLKMSGWFGHPQVARSQRSHAHFFVNSRAVNDRVLWHAVSEAYRDLLMKGKYPVLVLNLQVNEETVDVNVHPAKSEIRFHHSQAVHGFVKHVLREHLEAKPWLSEDLRSFADMSDAATNPADSPTANVAANLQNWSQKFFSGAQDKAEIRFPQGLAGTSSANSVHEHRTPYNPATETSSPPPQRQIQFGRTPYADMQPIGQWLGTYILCEARGKLILIDQHAAHERVGFEKLMLQYESNNLKSEALLVPETFDLKPSDGEIFKNYLIELTGFGLEVEFFGGNTFVIKAVPALLKGKLDVKRLIWDLVEDIKETGEMVALKDKLHHVLATMACHGQIRANHHLTLDEMSALLKELEHYQFTDFCPHGRPVSVEVTREEVEKWFRRVL